MSSYKTFQIGDFRLFTGKKTEELQEKIIVPTTVNMGKPSGYTQKKKIREFTVFLGATLLNKDENNYEVILKDIFDFIDLIEILKAFNQKKLELGKSYSIKNIFTAKPAQKNDRTNLEIRFKGFEYSLFFNRYECASLSAKFSKVLQKCEVWQE